MRGRGVDRNPTNRFVQVEYQLDRDAIDEASDHEWLTREVKTEYLRDSSRKLISYNKSQDIPFNASINPYRGCEHGCVYCYARPYHEYLGFSAGLDFETKIVVKEDAPQLLRKELSAKAWVPQVIGMSGVTDIYQPIERKLELTRRCLEVLADFRNPVGMITKNALITRDIDVLKELAKHQAVHVRISTTTLDTDLWKVMEPRTSHPQKRIQTLGALSDAGVSAGVMIGPVIPGLNDEEIPAILKAVGEAGVNHASYTVLRLPYGVKSLFEDWLETYFPNRKAKVLSRLDAVHGGQVQFGQDGGRMSGEGEIAREIAFLFRLGCKQAGIKNPKVKLSTSSFRREPRVRELF